MGGGKSGGGQTMAPPKPISTKTNVGAELEAPQKSIGEEDEKVEKGVSNFKKGTRGLRIALADKKAVTKTVGSATGVNI